MGSRELPRRQSFTLWRKVSGVSLSVEKRVAQLSVRSCKAGWFLNVDGGTESWVALLNRLRTFAKILSPDLELALAEMPFCISCYLTQFGPYLARLAVSLRVTLITRAYQVFGHLHRLVLMR